MTETFPITGWRRRMMLVFGLLLALLGATEATRSSSWESELEGGREISVDPQTNRVMIESGPGQGQPLWDGVHRLSDGSVITIRSGVMVPNEALIGLRRGEARPVEIPEASADCDELVLKVCGLNNECTEHEACDLAKQLRQMQWRKTGQRDGPAWAASRCQQALAATQEFPPCQAASSAVSGDVCATLVERVCGSAQRCAESEACQLARQLADLERTARQEGVEAHAADSRRQCQKMLGEHAFFPPCR